MVAGFLERSHGEVAGAQHHRRVPQRQGGGQGRIQRRAKNSLGPSVMLKVLRDLKGQKPAEWI